MIGRLSFNGMIDSGLEGAKVVQLARLTYEGQRLYPGLDASFWHPVIDKECLTEGVILKVRGGARFVWKHHVLLRDLPTPG